MSSEHYVENTVNDNKWSKNGFGEPCSRSGGKFSKEESETVRKAVEEYCSMKQITTSRLCSECDHKSELKGAWLEIAKRLPHRTVQSVYRHGLRQLHPFKRGPWNEDEQAILFDLVQRMGKKWSAIQAKLNRSADSCRDKYREMDTAYVKGRWKDGETESLKDLIREHLRADPNADIKDLGKMVEQEGIVIPWSVISKKMGKRSRLSCFKKWQKMTGLYSPSDMHKVSLTQVAEQDVMMATTDVDEGLKQETVDDVAILTAGAAAARAVANHAAVQGDLDSYLLHAIAQSGACREDDIDWASMRAEGTNIRWKHLVQEWQVEESPGDDLLELPVCEIAQLLLDRKQQAKMAAETVEAVDLPTIKTDNI